MKIRPLGAELRTERQILTYSHDGGIVDLCSFVNAPKRAVVACYVVSSWNLCGKTGEILDEALRIIGASSSMRYVQLPKAKEERS